MKRSLILAAASMALAPLLLLAAEGDILGLDAQVLDSMSVRLSWRVDNGRVPDLVDEDADVPPPPVPDGATFLVGYSLSPITEASWGEPMLTTRFQAEGLVPVDNIYSIPVTGLNPTNADTTYYFGVQSLKDGRPVGQMGKASRLVPGDHAGPDAPGDFQSSVLAGTLQLTWTAPADDAPTEGVVSYRVKYSLEPITAANFGAQLNAPGVLPEPLDPATLQWMQCPGLTPGVTYWFAIAAVDERSNLGDIATVQGGLPGPDDGGQTVTGNDDGNDPACGFSAAGGVASIMMLLAVLLLSIANRQSSIVNS